jgi:hypothetical protein
MEKLKRCHNFESCGETSVPGVGWCNFCTINLTSRDKFYLIGFKDLWKVPVDYEGYQEGVIDREGIPDE